MIGKAKALGLALVAAFALSAVAASAASAQTIHSGSGSGTSYATVDLLGINQLDTGAGAIKCTEIGGSASWAGTTTTEATFDDPGTVGVTYSGCTAFGLEMHFDTMGCDYLITGATATTGIFHIVCPTTAGGVKDEITITPTQGGVAICHIDIPEQTIDVDIANKAATVPPNPVVPDDIEITPTATGITYNVTQTAGGAKCGTTGLKHDMKYTGSTTVTGFSDANHTVRTGLTYT